MNQPLYIIGIDGGGTKTIAVLCALDGTILAEAQGGPTNFQIVDTKQGANILLDLIKSCCRMVGCEVSQIGSVAAGCAGAGRPSDQRQILDVVLGEAQNRGIPLNKITIESDARIALEGAFGGRPGIIVIAGTGSIVYGKDERERTYRAGGWGKLIGDEGSGHSIGRAAFQAVARNLDGGGEKTKLSKLFGDKLGLISQEAVIHALYKDKFDIASVAPLVMEAAVKGDAVARKILRAASAGLVATVETVLKKMNKGVKKMPKRPLAFAGSLLTSDNIYLRYVRSSLKRELPLVTQRAAESSPVVGAATLAIKLLKSGS
jgi:N-acetylglucosamine kinase-like BadF-type ATPase